MLDLPQWFHELASLATVSVAAGYLAVHLARIAKPREGSQPGCARCEHNAGAPAPSTATRGRRSKQLRVL